MRRARRTAVVAVLLLGLAAAVAPAAEAAKPVKCKKGQVKERVKVRKAKAKTRCVKAKKAWPAPKAVDVRAAGTRFVLDQDYAKVRDRRGRRAKSLPKLLRKVHPRAETALAAAVKAGLARMDARAAASQAGSGCGGSGGQISSTFDAGGGQSVDMTMTGGPDASLQLGMESRQGNRRVRIEIEFPGCESTQLDSCPTADGIVRGSDNRRIGIRAFVIENGRETWSQGIRLDGETTLRGVVADDAKLDFFEPHNTEVGVLTLGGSSRGFSPMSIRMLVQRITRVEMRGQPSYRLNGSIVNVTITSPDLTGSTLTATERQIESGMREKADEQFRDIIDKAIRKMRASEDHWNGPNNCATIQFTPASGSHPLRVGDTGSVSANLVSSRGGSPSRATWTHTGAGNGTFTPPTASSVPASFSYSGITAAGEGIFVTGSWKAVSKAGVAQDTWSQPTVSSAINTISGTFSGDQNIGGSILNWTGEATFVRTLPGEAANGIFKLQSASYTVTASDRALHIDCQQSGSKTITQTDGDMSSLGQPPDSLPPYDLSGSIIPIGPFNSTMTVQLSNCSDPENSPSSMVTSLAFTPLKIGGQSADGLDFSGNLTDTLGAVTNWHWSMRGTP